MNCLNAKTLFATALALALLTSCAGYIESSGPNYGPTLADLPEQDIPEDPMPIPVTSLDQIEESYISALEVASDPKIRHKILVRLADIEMARSEETQLDNNEQKAFFSDAISMYEELITLNAQGMEEDAVVGSERLMYQLSKAYALDGRNDESNEILEKLVTTFPESAFAAEADFRQAELAFSNQDYPTAELLYSRVMSAGADTPFYTNAVYMHGWTRFKRGRYRAAIPSFTEVLDRVLIEGEDFSSLSNSKRNIAKDTLRVLSIVFSYLDGAETITEVYASLGLRHYQYMLYSNLGELYFEKDRFRDSADTYLHYVKQFPDTEQSPAFSVKAIKVYEQGGFPSLVLPAKEEFITNYGVHSAFWAARTVDQQAQLKPYLKTYLSELSSFHHAEGQALDDSLVKYNELAAKGKKPKKKPEASIPSYLKAASLYAEFVFTFPQDPQTPEMTFLQGEAYYSAKRLPESIEAFEIVAYQYIDSKHGAESGYSALLIMSELIDAQADSNDEAVISTRAMWRERKITSAISFSDYYSSDKRAVPVLTKAAQELFEHNELERAITIAKRLTEWQPEQAKDLQKTAWLILAHSQFDLENYTDAEWAYRELLARLDQNDTQRAEVIDRIAASIYRQTELQVAGGDKVGSIDRLLSIRDVAPGTSIAATAQYDAINYLIEAKEWPRAEIELNDFAKRYPQHELINTLTPKYALVYQESEQWEKAAAILAIMAQSGDPETRRVSQYMAAELYERSGNKKLAIENYRNYANNFPAPFDIATEARFHLVELYLETNDLGKREYWLNRLIIEDAGAGSQRTSRSKYLAAMAMVYFAEQKFSDFERIKLTLPIKKSIKTKKKAMNAALDDYKKIIDFGIAEFATQATHRVAHIYSTLSRDLMDSQRPKGMDDLALEQYEILLEEQAYPFEEKAIDIYAGNTERTKSGIYDDWVKESFEELAKILPARYGKKEVNIKVSDEIY